MELWISRDEDGLLKVFPKKPVKEKTNGFGYMWIYNGGGYCNCISLDNQLFPSVTFENSPQQVDIKLI